MSVDAPTIAVYDSRAAEYAARFGNGGRDTALAAFIDALPRGARVLDLGCGPGQAATAMADAGLDVTATDASAEMIRLAATAHPSIATHRATFDEVAGCALYDGIWANFSLLHAPRADLPRHLATLRRALRDGGLFHIGMKTGSGEVRDSIGRLYTYVTEAELNGLLRDAGLAPLSSRTGLDEGLDGTPAPWITVTALA